MRNPDVGLGHLPMSIPSYQSAAIFSDFFLVIFWTSGCHVILIPFSAKQENKACPPIDTRSVRECRFLDITCLWHFFYYFWYSVFSSSNAYTHSALGSNPYECQPDKLQTAPVRRSYIAACQPDFLFSIRIFIIAFHNHAPLHFESYCPQNLQADDGARTPNRNRTAKPLFSIIQSNTSYLWNIHTIINPQRFYNLLFASLDSKANIEPMLSRYFSTTPIHQPEPCRTQRFFLIFLFQPPWNKKDFKSFSYKGFLAPENPSFSPDFLKKNPHNTLFK